MTPEGKNTEGAAPGDARPQRPNYWKWGFGMAGVDLVLSLVVIRYFPVHADAAIQAALLLDTLVVVAWYAHLTYQVAVTSQQQFLLAQQQFEFAERVTEAANRPCVVIDRKEFPSPRPDGPGWTFVAKNIGPGLAVTVVWIEELAAERPTFVHHVEPPGCPQRGLAGQPFC